MSVVSRLGRCILEKPSNKLGSGGIVTKGDLQRVDRYVYGSQENELKKILGIQDLIKQNTGPDPSSWINRQVAHAREKRQGQLHGY